MPTLELHFQRPAYWASSSAVWLNTLIYLVIGGALGLDLMSATGAGPGRALMVIAGALALGLAIWAVVRGRARKKPPAPLRAYSTHLVVPRSAGSSRTRRVDYADILSLGVSGGGPQALVFLGTTRDVFAFRADAFIEPGAFELLRAEVERQLLARPDGIQLLDDMAQREALGRVAWSRRPRVTFALLGVLVLAFALTSLAGGFDTPFGLVRFGANAPALVTTGQWYRLVAANFLHANLLHLYMNGMGLLMLGSPLERLLGSSRFVIIYVLSALGGSIASAYVGQAALSVGASTAIFGLLGSMAVVNWRFRRELPPGFRQPLRWWLLILGLNAALPLLLPQIDVSAHVGGFATGALATLVLCAAIGSLRSSRSTSPVSGGLAAVLAALCAAGLTQAVTHALAARGEDEAQLAQSAVDDGSASPDELNAIAWEYATSRAASAQQIALAHYAAERAAALAPDQIEVQDTLATVQYRRGELDLAINIERGVLREDDGLFYFSQVARFLDARLTLRGPLYIELPAGEDAAAPGLRVAPDMTDPDEPALSIELERDYPKGAELWTLVKQRERLVGAYVLLLGPNRAGARLRSVPDGGSAAPDLGKGPLELALVDASGCGGCAPGSFLSRYRRLDRAALELP